MSGRPEAVTPTLDVAAEGSRVGRVLVHHPDVSHGCDGRLQWAAAMGGCNGRLQWAAAVASNFPTLELLNRYLI